MNSPRHAANVVYGLIIGALAMGLIAVLLNTAVSSSKAVDSVNLLLHEHQEDREQIAAQTQQLADLRTAQLAADRLSRDRQKNLLQQNRLLQRDVRALAQVIRAHGLTVPVLEGLSTGSATGGNRPKAPAARPPHRKRQASPDPTGNTASADLLGWLCQLLHLSTCPHL